MNDNGFSAGAAREIITPPVGTLLFGYRPDTVSESVNDELTATALMLSSGDAKAMLVTLEVCEVSTELSDTLRAKISEAVGLPADNVIISATHTHSGPNTVGLTGWGDIDTAYCESILIPRTVKAALAAYENLRPAKLGIGEIQSDIGINRRQLLRDGTVILGQNPWGLYDPRLTVLCFRGLDGSGILNLIHYGCHGTASGCNHEITRDWAGQMTDRLEAESGCLTAFFNGAQGDVGPRLPNGGTVADIGYAMQLGAKAGLDAVKAYSNVKEYRESVSLTVISGDITLPYKQLPTLAEVEKKLKEYDGMNTGELINVESLEYHRLLSIKAFYDSKMPPETGFTFRQTLITLGPVAIIPFPFELFSEISLRLREYSSFAYTLCLSNANGANTYLPSQDQLCRGGYEVSTFTAGKTFCLTDDADNIIIDAALKLLDK